MATPRPVLVGYRAVLRSMNKVFRGDDFALTTSRAQLREAVLANAHVTDPVKLEELMKGFDEASHFLENHIVQAKLTGEGNYAVRLESHHADADGHIDVDPLQAPKLKKQGKPPAASS